MNNTSHLGLPEIQTTMATIVSNDYINSHITHPHPSHSFQPSTYNNGQSTQPFSPYSHISRPNHLCYNSSDTDLSTEIHFLHKQNEKISPRQNQKYIDTPQCLYAFQDSPMPSEKRELSTKSSVSALNESQNLHQGTDPGTGLDPLFSPFYSEATVSTDINPHQFSENEIQTAFNYSNHPTYSTHPFQSMYDSSGIKEEASPSYYGCDNESLMGPCLDYMAGNKTLPLNDQVLCNTSRHLTWQQSSRNTLTSKRSGTSIHPYVNQTLLNPLSSDNHPTSPTSLSQYSPAQDSSTDLSNFSSHKIFPSTNSAWGYTTLVTRIPPLTSVPSTSKHSLNTVNTPILSTLSSVSTWDTNSTVVNSGHINSSGNSVDHEKDTMHLSHELSPTMKQIKKLKGTTLETESNECNSTRDIYSSSIPRQQYARYKDDSYKPEWVRYTGHMKEGYCDLCKPGKWLQLKNSAYWYHKQFFHGISSVSRKPFVEPLKQRRNSNGMIEGLCHQCNSYVPISSRKRKNNLLWYRHAHKCHVYTKSPHTPKQ